MNVIGLHEVEGRCCLKFDNGECAEVDVAGLSASQRAVALVAAIKQAASNIDRDPAWLEQQAERLAELRKQ